MINQSISISMLVNVIASFLVLALPFILYKQNRSLIFKTVAAGAMVYIFGDRFILSTVLGLIFGSNDAHRTFVEQNPFLYACLVALGIALVHFLIRMFVARGIVAQEVKSEPTKSAVGMGLGQAGTESVLTIGIMFIQHLILINKVNNGTIYEMVNETITKGQIDQYVEVVKQYTALGLLLTLVKIGLFVALYVGLSIMTIKALQLKDKKQYGIVIMTHFAIMFIIYILELMKVNTAIQLAVTILFIGLLATYSYKVLKGEKHEKV